MERREFLKTGCGLCLGAALMAATGCTASKSAVYKTSVTQNRVRVPLAGFATTNMIIVRPKELLYDIAVEKTGDAGYRALLLKCTHQDNQLYSSGNTYTCSLHGSRFDRNGRVLNGPAAMPLKEFKTTTDQEDLVIIL